jgi:Ca-activated chloride channel family protein
MITMITPTTLPLMTEPELRCIPPTDDGCFGSLSTARGHLPLEAMDIKARVTGLVATVELEQTFVNTVDEPIEATYIFPLPDRAAVTRFRLQVGDRIIEGRIKERGQARADYEQAITAGHRAAITEEERPGTFTMRVGNLMPGDRAVVRLSLTGPLPIEDGEVTFRFPLVVAPRYIPGKALGGADVGLGVEHDTDAVPDASRISPPVLLPGYPNPVRLSLRVDLDTAGLPMRELRSSLHAVCETATGGRRRIELQPGERLDRDFIVRFRVGDDAVRTSLVLAPDAEGDEGTFMLTLVPPSRDVEPHKPRDVIFVLDRSGSMGGWKMIAARRAAARMVDTLNDSDRFAVYAFDDRLETPAAFTGDDLVQASDRNRFRAVEFLATLEARGGTEMAHPLSRAAARLAGGYDERERILVLVTDGQVGNEDQIVRALGAKLKNVRVFTLGVDRAVNEGFLRRLAVLGGGACELVESEDRLDEVMDRIHRRIATPIITEVAIEPAGLNIDRSTVVPQRPPDLFAGAPVVISGRYRGKPGSIAITGRDPVGDPWQERVAATHADAREFVAAISPVWARALLRDLEDQYAIGRGDRAALQARILATSLRFSVLCRFSAFVAVDEAERVNPGGELREVLQPVEMPSGWGMAGMAPAGMPAPAPQHMMRSISMPTMMGAPSAVSAPPSPSAPKKRRATMESAPSAPKPSLLSRMSGALRGRGYAGDEELDEVGGPEPEPRADLSSYRRRLEAIAARLDAVDAGAFERVIKRVIAELRALAEDLSSIGEAGLERDVRALATALHGRLASAVTSAAIDHARTAVGELAQRCSAAAAPAGRDAFWK